MRGAAGGRRGWLRNGQRRRRIAGPVSLGMSLVLVLGVVNATSTSAASGADKGSPLGPVAAKPPAKTASEAQDPISALALARLSKKPIEVVSARTETSTTFANADGTFTTDAHLQPVRYRDGHGEWRSVDLSMGSPAADGSVAPKAHARGLQVHGASDRAESDAVSVREGSGQDLTWAWKGKLPKPQVSGAEATYKDVQPGVDFTIEARRTGFEQLMTLRQRPQGPVSWTFPLKTRGLTVREDADGGVSFLNAKGKVVSRILPATAWDAKVDPHSGDPVNVSKVALSVTAKGANRAELTVTPDATWLADPAREFPVTVDPTYATGTVNTSFDTFVQSNMSSDQSSSTELRAGTYDGSTKARSYLNFPLQGLLHGQKVMEGWLSLYEIHSWSCTAKQVDVYNAAPASTSTTWSNQPTVWDLQGSLNVAKGYSSSCGAGWINVPITGLLQYWSGVAASTGAVQVRAANETDVYGWKKFASSETANDPHIWFRSDRAPNTPSAVSFSSPSAVGQWLSSKTPTLQATVTDPDGNLVRGIFEVWQGGTRVLGPVDGTLVNSGGTSAYRVPASSQLVEGSSYTIKAYAKDEVGLQSAGSATSAAVTVDVTPTGAPIVTSTDYPDDSGWHGGAGQAGTFTLSMPAGTTDLTKFYWAVDAAPLSTQVVNPDAGTTSGTLTYTPTTDGRHTLQVQAVDRAGNLSAITSYQFSVGRAGLAQPLDGGRFARRVQLATQVNDASLTHAIFQYRRGAGATWQDIPVGHLTTASGGTVTRPVQLSTIGGYLNWDALATLGPYGGVVDLRALMYTSSSTTTIALTTGSVSAVVDPTADGAASTDIGPGSVNLLTGDYTVDTTDADEFGMAVTRVTSSQDPGAGWVPQGERLTAAQIDVTAVTGFSGGNATIARSTARGHDSSDSLEITPAATPATMDTRAAVGGDAGGMRLGMLAGHRYRATGWVYVPAASGASGAHPTRGMRIVGFYKDSGGVYREVASAAATAADLDSWRQVRVDMAIPAGATEAFFRLYNGFANGSGKKVYWDDLSVREVLSPFGPAWSSGPGSDLTSDFQSLRFPTKNSAEITLITGRSVKFSRTSTNTAFYPEPGAESLALAADTVAGRFKLTESDGTITYFSQQSGGDQYMVSQVTPPDAAGSTQYVYTVDTTNKTAKISRVINPVESGVTGCTVAAPTTPGRGCEVLEYVYATSTTATAATPGDINGQVKAIKVWSTDPSNGTVSAIEVARYAYGTDTQLREVWDPRLATMSKPVLKTTYSYDATGRLLNVASPGETAWTFTYNGQYDPGAAGMPAPERVSKVAQGTVETKIVYGVPLTRGAGGPYDLNGASVAAWGQQDIATDATAVFPPQTSVTVANATSSTPGPDGYGTAAVHYLDAAGREVNTATPGGYIDTAEYDRFGNTIRSLNATNRMTALGQGSNAARWLAELGLEEADSVSRSRALDSVSTYTADGVDLLTTTGPVRAAVLEETAPDPDGAGPLTAIPAGTTVVARAHAVTTYDQGKPDAAKYHLPTTERIGATLFGYDPAYADVDARTSTTAYDATSGIGGTSGWTVRKPTRVTVDAGGLNVTSAARYDSAGRALESRKVDSAGGDARTTITVLYTAGANPDSLDGHRCGNRPEWAGQPCVTRPGGTVGSTTAPAELPTRFVSAYSRTGDIATVTESANAQTRTTTTVYDAADRVVSVATSGTSGAGTAIDTVYSGYDDNTGDLVFTYTKDANGTETGRIRRDYDTSGRLATYSDADSGSTSTQFDAYGRPSVLTMTANIGGTTVELGSKTYTYDLAKDPRGILTSVTDSVAGTISATYGPDGEITSQTFPGGITQTTTYDASGAAVARNYTTDTGTLIYSDQVVTSTHGQWAKHAYNGASRTYGYDRMGRLTATTSTAPGADTCTIRSYTYDHRANRESRTTTGGTSNAGGGCDASSDPSQTSTDTHSYDSGDRLIDAGYTYDAFGRTTSLPAALTGGGTAALTNSYYVNDLVQSQTLDSTRQSWTLDPAQRSRAYTVETQVNGSWGNASTKLNHYDGDTDEPAWIVEDTSQGTTAPVTRMVESLDGGLAATTSATGDVQLQLVNLHGDVAVELASDLTTLTSRFFDEFGVPEAETASGTGKDRYGWLGAAQRSGDALGDTILMGVRLYSPGLGRFLQMDPQSDGNASAYDYCNADPVNCTDLDGQWGWKKFFSKVAKVAEVASWIPGPIGTAAAGVSAVAYAASGNKAKALEMGIVAAAQLVGGGAAVRVGFRAVKVAARAGKASRTGPKLFRGAPGCDNSFDPGTPVLLADGQAAPIEELAVGDEVAAVDPSTGEMSAQPVAAVITGHGLRHMVTVGIHRVNVVGGGDTSTLTATAEHPIWVDGRGWLPARELVPGMHTRTADGQLGEVVSVEDKGWLPLQTVYNLTVANAHTFFVVLDSQTTVLVHNCSNLLKLNQRNFRKNLARYTGSDPGPDFHAHHIVPNKFRRAAARFGYDVHHPRNGQWVRKTRHLKGAAGYNKAWRDIFARTTSKTTFLRNVVVMRGKIGMM